MMNNAVSKELLATYRFQLRPDITFDRVCDLLPYFRDLGISHLYLSPCLKAAARSRGYDRTLPGVPADSNPPPRAGPCRAIQRCATVVVQNSLKEGFGLTATDAMWKRVPVLGSSACGLRLQIRDRIDGRLTGNPQDPDEIADALDEMLSKPVQRELYGRSAQRRVYSRFLVFTQVENWLRRLADVAAKPRSPAAPE